MSTAYFITLSLLQYCCQYFGIQCHHTLHSLSISLLINHLLIYAYTFNKRLCQECPCSTVLHHTHRSFFHYPCIMIKEEFTKAVLACGFLNHTLGNHKLTLFGKPHTASKYRNHTNGRMLNYPVIHLYVFCTILGFIVGSHICFIHCTVGSLYSLG